MRQETNKVINYSCHIGEYDYIGEHNKDLFVFTDGEGEDNTTKSRYYKINSHLIGEHDVSLYQDMCVEWLRPKEEFLEFMGDNDLLAFSHWHTSLIEEGNICRQYHIDIDEWTRIYHRYETEGFQDNIGLADGSVIARKNNNKVKQFNELWWQEFYKRDQLSMMYCIWKTGLTFKLIPQAEQWRKRHSHISDQ